MSLVVAVLAGTLLAPVDLVPADLAPPVERPLVLALNPQPEPPGKAKIKRIYSGGPDSRRGKTIKQTPANKVAPTKY
jgi:hypothetical protein